LLLLLPVPACCLTWDLPRATTLHASPLCYTLPAAPYLFAAMPASLLLYDTSMTIFIIMPLPLFALTLRFASYFLLTCLFFL